MNIDKGQTGVAMSICDYEFSIIRWNGLDMQRGSIFGLQKVSLINVRQTSRTVFK